MPLIRRRLSVRYRRRSMRRSRMSNYRRLRRRYRSRAGITTRGLRGAMIKWLDYDFYLSDNLNAMLPCTSQGSILTINLPTIGDAFNQRNGYRIKMLYLDLKLFIVSTGSVATTNYKFNKDLVRFAVIYDRNPNGLLPNTSDIFAGNTNSTTTTYPAMCHMNLLNRDRFLILADKHKFMQDPIDLNTVNISPWVGVPTIAGGTAFGSTLSGNPSFYSLRKNIKLRGLETLYKGASSPGSIGDISLGALYLYTAGLLPPVAPSGHAKWAISGQVRFKFVDA